MGETPGPEVVIYRDEDPILLTTEEVRVLGVLVEKQITTPDYYPLSLNALVNGCNQTSSREPVVHYDEVVVTRALNALREKKLAFVYAGADSRTLKYGHKLRERVELTPGETAALCVLMLRGPQTAGEIRNRSGRLHEFASLAEVEETLESLAARPIEPLAVRLPRQSGLKEARFTHLMSGPPVLTSADTRAAAPVSDLLLAPSNDDRMAALQAEISALRSELAELRQQFAIFKQQFE
ncbi:MAG: YceH family protein [Opitutus sp.]